MTNDRQADENSSLDSEPARTDLFTLPVRGAVSPERDLLPRAGEFIAHLRSQLAELDRREQNVNAQYSALDQERRRLRLSSQQFDEEMRRREEALAQREAQLTATRTAWEATQQEVATQRDLVNRSAAELAEERGRVERQFAGEFAQQQQALEEQRRQLEQLHTKHEHERRTAVVQLQQELDEVRSRRIADIEQELAELNAEILEKRQWWDEEQARAQERFETELEAREQQLAGLAEEFEQQQSQGLAELEQRAHELERRHIDVEKRTNFHESHLEQLRRTLEQRQHELEARQQALRARHVRGDRELRLRSVQLQRFREVLDHREESLDRERGLLTEARQSWESLRQQEQARWAAELEASMREQASQRADVQRQTDMLSLHAENLESRRTRLDGLRDELETAHRETLEMRLAVEQTWAQLAQTFGEATARQRVEQFRTAIGGHFEEVRQALTRQRQELEEIETRLERQRETFRTERREFSTWITERDVQLRNRESSVQQEIDAAEQRESQWQATRERWLREKLEAESVIRQLLSELDLGIATASPFDAASHSERERGELVPLPPAQAQAADEESSLAPSPAAA